jgi:DHA1 family inner membrane transport protein
MTDPIDTPAEIPTDPQSGTTPTTDRRVSRVSLATIYVGRFAGNWSLRFIYPFLPVISRGLGIPLETLGLIAGARELTGVIGPLLARPIDRSSQRRTIIISLVALGLAMGLAVATDSVAVFAAGLAVSGAAKTAYDMVSNAWIADHVAYQRRGRIVGLVETSWAGAFLVGVPATAVMIGWWGWRAPFVAIAILSFVMAAVAWRTLRSDDHHQPAPGHAETSSAHLSRSALAFYLMMLLQSGGPQLVFASYGAWFSDSFGLGVEAIGLATAAIGGIELFASVSSARLTDRLGKRRSILLGMGVAAPALALLGIADSQVATALALLAVSFVGFEFAIVSSLPLASELNPEARATGLGATFAALTLGRGLATVAGVALYVHFGIGWTGLIAAGIVLLGIGVLLVGVREPDQPVL